MDNRQDRFNLKIYLLGAPEVLLRGQPLTSLPIKSQALLFYLAMTRQSHTRLALATLLWGDSAEKNARASLRKVLQQLRQTLPDHLILTEQSVALHCDETVWVDAVHFAEQTARAEKEGDVDLLSEIIQHYRGDFLSAFFAPKAPAFERWQADQLSRLREQMLSALQMLSRHWSAHNNLAEAIAVTRRIVESEPWREQAHRQLIELLARNGERGAALAHFDVCREQLQRELAVQPGAATLDLVAKIRAGEIPHTNAGQPTLLPSRHVRRARGAQPVTTLVEFPLVGREHEWQLVQELWYSIDQPHFLCISGEAGIGKTRLAQELLLTAEREGAHAARTRSHALQGQLAYGPITDWLRSTPLQAELTKLEDVWLTELARLLPELLIDRPTLSPPEPLHESWQRKRFFDALRLAFTAIDGPLLLVLDDLQWSDVDTLEWIQYLVESATGKLLVAGTGRSDEIDDGHPLQRLRQQLARDDKFTELPLSPLSAAATAALATRVTQHQLAEDASEQLFQETAGNPLFVIETMRTTPGKAVATPLPPHPAEDWEQAQRLMPAKIYRIIQARLAQLSSAAQTIAQLGATIGRSFDVSLLRKAAGLDEDAVFAALDELWQRRVIYEMDALHFDFSHDRIRDVAYAEITPLMRRRLHRNVAEALEMLYLDDLDAVCGHLATHCEAAGQLEQAVRYYQRAADGANALFAHKEAAHKRQRALRLLRQLPRSKALLDTEIDLQLALFSDQTYAWGYGSTPAGKALQYAYKLIQHSGTPTQRCSVLIKLMQFHRVRGEWFLSKKFTQKAHVLAEKIGDSELITLTRTNFAIINLHLGDLEQASAFFEQIQPMSSIEDGSGGSLSRYRHCLWLLGFPELACRTLAAELQFLRETDHWRLAMVLHHDAMLQVFRQDLRAVELLTNELIAVSTERNDDFCLRCGNIYRGWLLARQGLVDEGVSLTRENADEHRERGNGIFECIWRSLLAESYLLASNLDAALTEIDSTLVFAEKSGDCHWNAQLLKFKGDALQASGAPDAKVAHQYQLAIDAARRQKARSLELRATTSLCRLWQKQGKVAEAHARLSNIYGWFTEGFGTHDLVAAKALLDELAT